MDTHEIATLVSVEQRHWWYSERRALIRAALRGVPPGRAVDIGAAGGGNTQVLQSLGWSAIPVDYDQGGAVVAAGRGLPSVRGDACRLPFATASLDLAVAFDVLEHLADDRSAAREIARVLRPGGLLLVAVPADPRLWSEHDTAVGHERRYTRETLRELLDSAGLVIDDLRSWNVLLRPAVAVRRKRSRGSDLGDPPGPLNLALRGVVAVERLAPVLGRLPGVSLLVRAHAP